MKSQKCAENSQWQPKKNQITIIQPSASTTFKHTATQQPQLEKEHTHFFVQKFINKIKLALN